MRNRTTRVIASLAMAVTALLATAFGTSSTGRAPARTSVPPAPNSASGATKGFDVYNLGSTPVRFVVAKEYKGGYGNWTSEDWDSSAPPNGSVLEPGQVQHFEVTWHALWDTAVAVTYSGAQQGGFWLSVPLFGKPSIADSGRKCPTDACDFSGTTVTFLDPVGTVHDIGPLQGQAQAQVLSRLCGTTDKATCKFKVTKEEHVEGPATVIRPIIENKSLDDAKYTLECSNTIGWSDSIGGSLKAQLGVEKVASAEISVEYKHDITADNVFTATLEMTIRPGYLGWVTHAAPLYRDWGDFTVTMGNTTWHLTSVYFDSPNSDPAWAHQDVWSPETQKIGPPAAAASEPVTRAAGEVQRTAVKRVAAGSKDSPPAYGVDICKQTHG